MPFSSHIAETTVNQLAGKIPAVAALLMAVFFTPILAAMARRPRTSQMSDAVLMIEQASPEFVDWQYPRERSSRKMDQGYNKPMDINDKIALTRQGDMSLEACTIRLRAARLVTGMQQKEFAAAASVGKTAYNNMEAGLSFPSRDVMKYLYRGHRIDFNFILHGDFAQLPADVQAALFAQLPVAAREWDRREGSGPSRSASPGEPQTS